MGFYYHCCSHENGETKVAAIPVSSGWTSSWREPEDIDWPCGTRQEPDSLLEACLITEEMGSESDLWP